MADEAVPAGAGVGAVPATKTGVSHGVRRRGPLGAYDRLLAWRLEGLPPGGEMGEVEERGLGTIEWIFSASLRMPRATIAALATAWTGIILALWVGAVSAIGSVVITAFGLTASGHFAGVLDFTSKTSGGIVFLSALIAAVVGFGTGFSATYASSLFASVSVAGAALFIGIVVGMVFGLIGTVMEPRLLAWRGYRRPSEREWNDHLTNALQTVVDNMKLRTTPRLLIMDTPIPQAWTYSRTIVLSKGLLEGLDRGELAGVLAHEMVHWRRGDGLALRMVWCFGWPVGVLYNIGMFLSGARFPSPSGGASGGGTGAGAGEIPNVSGQSVVKGAVTFLTFFGWMILWPTWLLTKFFVVPMTAANSRTIEYEADAGADAAELGGGLARALAQLSAFEIPRNAWDAALTSTHPPVELRIEAVEAHSYKAPDAVEDVTPLPAKRAKTMFGILVVLAALAVSPHVPGWHGHSNWWW